MEVDPNHVYSAGFESPKVGRVNRYLVSVRVARSIWVDSFREEVSAKFQIDSLPSAEVFDLDPIHVAAISVGTVHAAHIWGYHQFGSKQPSSYKPGHE